MDHGMFAMQQQMSPMPSQMGISQRDMGQERKERTELDRNRQDFSLPGRDPRIDRDYFEIKGKGDLERHGDERNQRDPRYGQYGDGNRQRDGEKAQSKDRDEWRQSRYKDDNGKEKDKGREKDKRSPKGSEIKSIGETTETKSQTRDKAARDQVSCCVYDVFLHFKFMH